MSIPSIPGATLPASRVTRTRLSSHLSRTWRTLGVALAALVSAVTATATVDVTTLPDMQFHTGTVSTVIYNNAIAGSSTTVWGDPTTYTSADIDANGWFKRLNSGDKIWYNISAGVEMPGVYVLTWSGSGTIFLDCPGNVQQVLLNDTTNRRIVALVPADTSIRVVLTATNPADPIRDIKCWYPSSPGAGSSLTSSSNLTAGNVTGSTEPAPGYTAPRFHQLYLDHVKSGDTGVIRFMQGWMKNINGTNRPASASWANRTPQTYANQNAGNFFYDSTNTSLADTIGYKSNRGVCFEDMIDLCNATGKDLWIQVNDDDPESFWRNLADLVATRLNSNLRVWAEFSNELWNSAGSYAQQNDLARQVYADANGVSLSSVDKNGPKAGWGSGQLQGRFLKAFKDQWTRVNGKPANRFIGVASGWQQGSSFNPAAYASAESVESGIVDVFAVTTYFGNSIQGKLATLAYDTNGDASEATYLEAAYIAETDILERVYPAWQNAVANLPVPVVAYEGGQHILGIGYLNSNPGFGTFLANLNRHPRMRDLYLTHWHLWKSTGARTASLFTDLGKWDQGYGYWGAKEKITDTGTTHAKWQAFLDYTLGEVGVRKLGVPQGSAPTFTTTSLANAEVGKPYSQSIVTAGGNGTRTLAHVGGFLPPGITFTATTNGGGTLSGTPTASGIFYVLLRVLDGDKDPAYSLLTLDTKIEGYVTNNLINFSKSDLTTTYAVNRGDTDSSLLRAIRPFGTTNADRLFATSSLPADSDLNIYGGMLSKFTEIPGVTNTHNPNATPSLKIDEGVIAWHSGTQELTSEDVWMLVWRKDQFNHFADGTVSFGDVAKEASLSLVSDSVGPNGTSLRFVIQNGSTWYVSEAAYTDTSGGEFLLQEFNNNPAVGKRWAAFTPTANNFELPGNLSYGAVNFDDVQAVGVHMYGKLNRYGWNHALDSFVALGRATPVNVSQNITFNFTGTAPGVNYPWTQTSALQGLVLSQGLTYGGTVGYGTGQMTPVGPGWMAVKGGGSADNNFRFGLWNPNSIDGVSSTRSTLADARSASNYLTFTVSAPYGDVLYLNGGTLSFTYNRFTSQAAKDLAIFTSVGGFGSGAQIATYDDQTGQFTINLNGAGYDGITSLEIRIYLYDAIYNAAHQSAISALGLTNNL